MPLRILHSSWSTVYHAPIISQYSSRFRNLAQVSSFPSLRLQHTVSPPRLTESYVAGSTSTPLIESTLGDFWDKQVAKYGDHPALVVRHENNLQLTYSELDERVSALARGLYASGVRKGDRLGVFMLNNSAWVTLQHACAKMGIILTTINPGYRIHELEHALRRVEVKSLVTTPRFKTSHYVQMIEQLAPELRSLKKGEELHTEKLPSLRQVIIFDNNTIPMDHLPSGMIQYQELLQKFPTNVMEDPIKTVPPTLNNRETINIQFTSGTTGNPKGVSLSHRNLLNNGFQIGERMRLTPKDKLCIPVPLMHCFGLVLGSLAAVTHGSCSVYPAEGFDPLATLQAVTEQQCTALHGVPTMFISEMAHPLFEEFTLDSLRTGIAAGSPVPIETMKNIMSKMHMSDITICYGMTETSPVSFQTESTDSIIHRCESVGLIHPHVEAKVINSTGKIVPIGESGELCVRGYNVMEGGYWASPQQTAEVIDDEGWMHTGDQAIIDEEGYCKIVGRIKDMIIRGGENIAPVEIEDVLYRHPDIENVAIVGVPDKVYGEKVCAIIIPKYQESAPEYITVDSIKEFCKEKLSHFKIPSYVILVKDNNEEFPKTVSGKVMKHLLRQRARKILNL